MIMSKTIVLFLVTRLGFSTKGFEDALEIGAHVPGEVLVLELEGSIPEPESLFRVNVTHSVPFIQKDYTYFRVNYENSVAPVGVTYNKAFQIVSFMVKVPFSMTHYAIVGYALPEEPIIPTTAKVIVADEEKQAKNTYPDHNSDESALYPE